MKPTAKRPAGFTLIEMLVVIAIIGVLIAILLPALGAARRSASATKCLSHHRSLAQAVQMYTVDFEGYFPQPFQDSGLDQGSDTSRKTSALWFNALDDYLGQLSEDDYSSADERNYNEFKQDPVYNTFGEDTGQTGGNGSRTIKMNQNFGELAGGVGNFQFHKLTSLASPTETVVFFDGVSKDMGLSINSTANTAFHGDESWAYVRHGGSVNVAFADAHASAVKQQTQDDSIGSVQYKSWFDEPDARQELIWDFDAP